MYSHTVFSDLVKQIDRGVFAGIVKTHAADKYGKCFKSWQHLVAMLYCQFSGAKSLRAAEIGYNSHANAHYHLGLDRIKRSTLSQSNNARAPEVFRDMARHLIGRAHALTPELAQVVQLIDASPIIYKGRHNQWTKDTRCARIDGLKLHLSFGLEDKVPGYVNITDAKVNDITDAVSHLPLKAGIVYVFDKGYCDYNWWHGIARMGSVFVTRLKANAACKAVESHAIDPQHAGFILKDQTILLTHKSPRGGKKNMLATEGIRLRRIEVARADGKSPLILVCNDLDRAASVIADLYKARWQVELFFKWIKGHLKVKTFLGETKNSITIQVYCAIIAYLLLWLWKKLTQRAADTITHVRIFIQAKLFDRIKTEEYLRKRRYPHPNQPQLMLAL